MVRILFGRSGDWGMVSSSSEDVSGGLPSFELSVLKKQTSVLLGGAGAGAMLASKAASAAASIRASCSASSSISTTVSTSARMRGCWQEQQKFQPKSQSFASQEEAQKEGQEAQKVQAKSPEKSQQQLGSGNAAQRFYTHSPTFGNIFQPLQEHGFGGGHGL